MSVRLIFVDSFTPTPFGGNPAAVCLLDAPAPDEWLQTVGAELDRPATAFVAPGEGGGFGLRWFTAATELALCGHGTLAAAHALWETGTVAPTSAIEFSTKGGPLRASRSGDGWITLDFPALASSPVPPPAALLESLGDLSPVATVRGEYDVLVEVATEAEVRAAQLDLRRLLDVEARGLILTAPADEGAGYDFVSRFFCPSIGYPEDHATGSAHCALAPYWLPRLGRPELVGYQASPRGAYLRVSQPTPDRVAIAGQATTVSTGTLAPVAEPALTG